MVKPSTSGITSTAGTSTSKSSTSKKPAKKTNDTIAETRGKTLNNNIKQDKFASKDHGNESGEDADDKVDGSEYYESNKNSKLTPMTTDIEPIKNIPKYKQSKQIKSGTELVKLKKLARPLIVADELRFKTSEPGKHHMEVSSSSSSLMILDEETTHNEESVASGEYSAGTSREISSLNSSHNIHPFKINSPKNSSNTDRNEDDSMQNESNHDYFDELNNKSGSLLSANSYELTKNNSDTISFINQSHLSPSLKKC